MLLYLVARIVGFLSRRLPQRFLYALAVVLGGVLYAIWPRARCTAQENMRLALGATATPQKVRRAAREAFRNFARYCVEFMRDHTEYKDKITFSGIDNVDSALSDGNGAILVTLHMGSWELAALMMCEQHYKLNVVVDKFVNDRVNHWVQRMRGRLGMKVVAAREGLPSLVRSLRRNEVLALLIDCPRLGHIKVKFLGSQAAVPGGAAALALRTGAKVIPSAMVRLRDNKFKTVFQKPVEFQPTGDFSSDVEAYTQRIMESLEAFVREYPDQWFMFRRIWV